MLGKTLQVHCKYPLHPLQQTPKQAASSGHQSRPGFRTLKHLPPPSKAKKKKGGGAGGATEPSALLSPLLPFFLLRHLLAKNALPHAKAISCSPSFPRRSEAGGGGGKKGGHGLFSFPFCKKNRRRKGREGKGAFRKSRRNWKDHKRFPGQGGKEGGGHQIASASMPLPNFPTLQSG